ncbi:MAG: multiheme c-type cytochrome [Myxococcota bacterium]
MAYATEEIVAAPFAGEELRVGAATVAFGRLGRDHRIFLDRVARRRIVPADSVGDDGLRVSATFGVEPLQQFLLDAVDGRVQVLPWAFDTRPRSEGGQRWLDLYPEASADPSDPLHFMRPAQNWNHVCADCHVTGFRKRFNAERGRFESRWEEFGVGCEGCHGPGSAHVGWAASREGGGTGEGTESSGHTDRDDSKGLLARLDERHGVVWAIDAKTGNAVRSVPRTGSRELDVCAQCHSRRSAISEDYVAGEPFLDHYRPALLEEGLYYADGQQRDEVYGWGSFLQSRMHAKGVTCSDCHDPHSGGLRAEGNALCASCHAATKYATPKHHHHETTSSGSQCVACHMPTTTYMQIDPRHDHSLRVPRPDQAAALGVPDACGSCHGGNRAAWAAAAVRRWLGRPAQGFARHAEAMHAADGGAQEAAILLRTIAADLSHPPIVRASALARLDAARGPASEAALVAATRDPEPLVRLGALEGLATAAGAVRSRAAAALLDDPLRVVRFEAVRRLASIESTLSAPARAAFAREAAAYAASLRRDADRAEARAELGGFLLERGDPEGARLELEAAIGIEPAFEAGYANLADLERALGRDEAALQRLEAGLARLPGSAVLHHARGLALVRLGRSQAALADLERAAALAPASTRFGYVHAVALHSAGEARRAIGILEAIARTRPGELAVREALVAFYEGEGRTAEAAPHRAALARAAAAEQPDAGAGPVDGPDAGPETGTDARATGPATPAGAGTDISAPNARP